MFDSEPFGQRAVRLGLVTSEQVREALETQKMLAERGGLLGEILVEMGWMDPSDYVAVVQELMEEGDIADHGQLQEEFVKRAIRKKVVDPANVENARKIHDGWSRKNKLIGQVMVDMGFLDGDKLSRILSTYERKNRQEP